MKKKRFKGFTVNAIGPIALVLIVAAITISLGGEIQDNFGSVQCSNAGYTYGNFAGSDSTNPLTGNKYGCCQSVNASDSTDCDTWWTGNVAFNITDKGLDASLQLGNWLPTIALIVAAAIIIGILVVYLGRYQSRGA